MDLHLLSSRLPLLSECHILMIFLYVFYTYSNDPQTSSKYAQNTLRNACCTSGIQDMISEYTCDTSEYGRDTMLATYSDTYSTRILTRIPRLSGIRHGIYLNTWSGYDARVIFRYVFYTYSDSYPLTLRNTSRNILEYVVGIRCSRHTPIQDILHVF